MSNYPGDPKSIAINSTRPTIVHPPVSGEEMESMIQRLVDLTETMEREHKALARLLDATRKLAHEIRTAAERMPRG